MFSRSYRCEDGHPFMADSGKWVVASVHFGGLKYLRCPVDRYWQCLTIKRSAFSDDTEELKARRRGGDGRFGRGSPASP